MFNFIMFSTMHEHAARSGGVAVQVEGGIQKRVISVTTSRGRAGGHVFRGGRYYKKE